ncbi:MAG: hypothetical protein IJX85_02000 [Lachnospiraceae bacterium]|nr:hypothetical protein [Lachnospiraceae bacterium]
MNSIKESRTDLETLRNDIVIKQKKGLPFICASVVVWILIVIVIMLDLPQEKENLFVFCCSCPLLPISWMIGKVIKVDIFDKSNPLGNVGFLFTCNQFLYLLIVMWVFSAVPDKMVMVYAMVFGAHLLPYSWLYKSLSYRIFSIAIPIVSLIVGCVCSAFWVAVTMVIIEIIFVIALFVELRKYNNK